ncbi:MAG: retron system putative HNH endonuclease [Thermodesulfobacteriota bacterium]|nr:retron system putative HNH endonuclease [Thermodesulfobacteriota bacterium]
MKYIQKGIEPQELTDWKSLANDDWQPDYDSMGGQLKNAVKESLMQEQGYLCCYCERRLILHDSHIEHFNPQSNNEIDPLDYSNMLCSCQNRLKKGEPRHCGNLKDKWFDYELLVSPFDQECENRFSFKADGKIKSADKNDNAANITIKEIGLDIPKLNDLRRKTIEPFIDDILSEQDLRIFVTAYLEPDPEGVFGEFYMTIKSLFGDYTKQ